MTLQELYDEIKAIQVGLNKFPDTDEKININLFLKYLRYDVATMIRRETNMRERLNELQQRIRNEL